MCFTLSTRPNWQILKGLAYGPIHLEIEMRCDCCLYIFGQSPFPSRIELSKDGREISHEIVFMLSNGLDRQERDNLVQFYKPFQVTSDPF